MLAQQSAGLLDPCSLLDSCWVYSTAEYATAACKLHAFAVTTRQKHAHRLFLRRKLASAMLCMHTRSQFCNSELVIGSTSGLHCSVVAACEELQDKETQQTTCQHGR